MSDIVLTQKQWKVLEYLRALEDGSIFTTADVAICAGYALSKHGNYSSSTSKCIKDKLVPSGLVDIETLNNGYRLVSVDRCSPVSVNGSKYSVFVPDKQLWTSLNDVQLKIDKAAQLLYEKLDDGLERLSSSIDKVMVLLQSNNNCHGNGLYNYLNVLDTAIRACGKPASELSIYDTFLERMKEKYSYDGSVKTVPSELRDKAIKEATEILKWIGWSIPNSRDILYKSTNNELYHKIYHQVVRSGDDVPF